MTKIVWMIDNKLRCTTCKEYKELSSYHKDNNRAIYGVCYQCKECAIAASKRHHSRRMQEDPAYKLAKKNSYIKSRFGITLEEYDNMLAGQQYKCGLCGSSNPIGGWHLDHNHSTGEIRSFLCSVCNRGLGYFQDSPELLRKAVAYLETHGAANRAPGEGICQ